MDGKRKRIIYQMIDRRDLETGLLTPTRDIPSDIFIQELEKRGINFQRAESDA